MRTASTEGKMQGGPGMGADNELHLECVEHSFHNVGEDISNNR